MSADLSSSSVVGIEYVGRYALGLKLKLKCLRSQDGLSTSDVEPRARQERVGFGRCVLNQTSRLNYNVRERRKTTMAVGSSESKCG